MHQRELTRDEVTIRKHDRAGHAIGARHRNLFGIGVNSCKRAELRIEQAHLRAVGFEPQHRSRIDHTRIHLLPRYIDHLDSLRRRQVLAHAENLAIAHQDGAVFDSRSREGVNGRAAKKESPAGVLRGQNSRAE